MARTQRIISTQGIARDSGGGKLDLGAAMATGNALSDVGGTISKIAQQKIAIETRKQAESDRLEATKIASDFAIESDKTLEELKRTQENADGFTKVATESYDALAEKFANYASNENVRKLVKLNVMTSKPHFTNSAISYEHEASLAQRENNLDTAVANMSSLVLKNPNNYTLAMKQAISAVDSITNLYSHLEKEAKKKDIASELSVAYISSLIDKGNVSQAMSEVNNNKLVVESLSTKQKIALEKQATAKSKSIRAESTAQTSSLMTDNIASIMDTGVAVKGADPYSLFSKGMITKRQMDKYNSKIEQAQRMHEFSQELTSNSLQDSMITLSNERPKGGEKGYSSKLKEYQAKAKIISSYVENLSKDMVGTVLPHIDEIDTNNLDTPDSRRKISTKLAQVDVPVNSRVYFTKSEVDKSIQELNTNSANVKNWVDEHINNGYEIPIYAKNSKGDLIQTGTKNSGVALIEAMSLRKDAPEGVRSLLLTQDNPMAMQDIMNANHNYADNKKLIDSKKLNAIKTNVANIMSNFVHSNISINPNSSGAMANIQNDVYKLAVAYSQAGKSNPEDTAYETVIGNTMQSINIGNASSYIPKSYKGHELDADFVETYAKGYIADNVDYKDLLLSTVTDAKGIKDLSKIEQDAAKSNFENFATFVPNSSGTGLVLMAELSTGDRVVVKHKDGTPYNITFDEIIDASSKFNTGITYPSNNIAPVNNDLGNTLVIGAPDGTAGN